MAECEKYLKSKDKLLFEIYVTGKLNKISILFDIICAFIIECIFDSKENHYILGIGKSNIYVLYIGKYYHYDLIPKDVKPKKVRVIEIQSTKSISISPIFFGSIQRIKIIEKNNTHVYYIGKKFITRHQLQCLKDLSYS